MTPVEVPENVKALAEALRTHVVHGRPISYTPLHYQSAAEDVIELLRKRGFDVVSMGTET